MLYMKLQESPVTRLMKSRAISAIEGVVAMGKRGWTEEGQCIRTQPLAGCMSLSKHMHVPKIPAGRKPTSIREKV